MASFSHQQVAVYSSSGDTASLVTAYSDSATVTDNEADGTFEVGDQLFLNGVPTGTFVGTIMVRGNACVVIQSGSTLYIVSPVAVPISYYPPTFSISSDPSMSDFIVCFATGTMIATPDGEHAVETLEIGDPILTADGETVPVKWIGRQTVHKTFTPAERFVPVRMKAGALGRNVPHSDLVLTGDHALSIDGLLINAGALVNGGTVIWEPLEALPEQVVYYHIETEAHDIVLANGAAAETFVDHVTRRRFDNFAEYTDLYGDERTVPCRQAPRVSAARLVPRSIREPMASPKVA